MHTQHRLCAATEPLSEHCFMRSPLEFVGSTQTLRWRDGSERKIAATRVSQGTSPPGSTWTRNPIPACSSTRGCGVPEFSPPPGCNETCWGDKAY